ncbi:GNAT family N-acetyltransferase [Sphingomonas sp. MMS24-J13]|uniref:GNAT family N-acetyltransferase n=1 Tax=Sphingomonas sp. MMS24-J13 TaxID=3238686 RepID=UPI00384DE40B
MPGDFLAWRVEAACLDAWPCAWETTVDGWLIRFSGGPTRRTNSINPLPGPRAAVAATLDRARGLYATLGQPVLFRVPDIAPGVDAALDTLGFGAPEAATVTLHAKLADCPRGLAGVARVGPLDEEWLEARARLIGWDAAAMQVYTGMLQLIAGPVAFASVRSEGRIVAVAYGALSHGLLVIELVVTDDALRRRGFGRQVVAALLDWARGEGVDEACLQVLADNDPARALYRGLGFAHELYRYHYRWEER